jgi:hypothetical protein
LPRPGVDPFFAYDANYLIDNKVRIIVDAEGTRANRTVEITITETMIDRAKRRFDLRPQRLAGDSVYGAVRPSPALARNILGSNKALFLFLMIPLPLRWLARASPTPVGLGDAATPHITSMFDFEQTATVNGAGCRSLQRSHCLHGGRRELLLTKIERIEGSRCEEERQGRV